MHACMHACVDDKNASVHADWDERADLGQELDMQLGELLLRV